MRDYFRNRQVLGSIRQLDVVVPSFFPRDGLVAYYKLDGNSNDSVGSNDGTDTDVSYVAGKINQSGSFNGSTSKISLPSSFYNLVDAWTYSFWIKRNNPGVDNETIYSRWTNSTTGRQIVINFDNSNHLVVDVPYKSGIVTTETFTDSTKYHNYVFTKSGTNYLIYCDGRLSYSGTITDTQENSATSPMIGYNTSGGARPLNGLIDEVGIWNRALTPDEITQLYNNGNGLTYN